MAKVMTTSTRYLTSRKKRQAAEMSSAQPVARATVMSNRTGTQRSCQLAPKRVTAKTTTTREDATPKSSNCERMVARGKISRGIYIFVTRFGFPIRLVDEKRKEPAKNAHTKPLTVIPA